jgi:putative transposase
MRRREAVAWAMEDKQLSQRRACHLMTQPRGTLRRIPQEHREDDGVESRLLEPASAHGTWGCPQLHQQLRREGHRINHKRTHRLYRKHGMSLRRRLRRRLPERVQQPLFQQLHPSQVWSTGWPRAMDFMIDTLVNRRTYRTFNVIDDCARDVLAIEIDFSLTGERIVRVLQQL